MIAMETISQEYIILDPSQRTLQGRYSALSDSVLVEVQSDAESFEVELPDLRSASNKTFMFKCFGANPVTIRCKEWQKIDNVENDTVVINDGDYVAFTSNGVDNWIKEESIAGSTPIVHNLVGSYHSASGLTAGHFLKATSPTSFGFGAHGLTYSDVGAAPEAHGVTVNYLPYASTSTAWGNSPLAVDTAEIRIMTNDVGLRFTNNVNTKDANIKVNTSNELYIEAPGSGKTVFYNNNGANKIFEIGSNYLAADYKFDSTAEITTTTYFQTKTNGATGKYTLTNNAGNADAGMYLDTSNNLVIEAGGGNKIQFFNNNSVAKIFEIGTNYLNTAYQFQSTLATGTAPFSITSTTLCSNLNADKWDSLDAPANATGALYNNGSGTLSWQQVATGTGTANVIPKWSNTTGGLTNSDVTAITGGAKFGSVVPLRAYHGGYLAWNAVGSGTSWVCETGDDSSSLLIACDYTYSGPSENRLLGEKRAGIFISNAINGAAGGAVYWYKAMTISNDDSSGNLGTIYMQRGLAIGSTPSFTTDELSTASDSLLIQGTASSYVDSGNMQAFDFRIYNMSHGFNVTPTADTYGQIRTIGTGANGVYGGMLLRGVSDDYLVPGLGLLGSVSATAVDSSTGCINLYAAKLSGSSEVAIARDESAISVFNDFASTSRLVNILGSGEIKTTEDGLDGKLSRCLFIGTADKTIANTSTETTLCASSFVGTKTIPANFLQIGKTFRFYLSGYYSTKATTVGSLTFKIKYGSTVIASVVIATGDMELNASNYLWSISGCFTCRTTGATGTIMGQGAFRHQAGAPGTGTDPEHVVAMLNTSAVTIDTTASSALDVTAQWGTANASNTITCTCCQIEEINA